MTQAAGRPLSLKLRWPPCTSNPRGHHQMNPWVAPVRRATRACGPRPLSALHARAVWRTARDLGRRPVHPHFTVGTYDSERVRARARSHSGSGRDRARREEPRCSPSGSPALSPRSASGLSPAGAPHSVGRRPAARTAAAMVEPQSASSGQPSPPPAATAPRHTAGLGPWLDSRGQMAAPQRSPGWETVRTGHRAE